jgi:putative Holliday junction resolvase
MQNRIIGLDLGSKTCGVAISDQGRLVARALTTIRFPSDDYDDCFDQLLELLESEKIKDIVLGLPKHMNGDIGERGQLSIDFADELTKEGYNVTLWDERLTTVSAHRILSENNVRGKKRKNVVDAVAADIILQDYIDSRKNR